MSTIRNGTKGQTDCLLGQVHDGFAILVFHMLFSSKQALFEDELNNVKGL